MSARWDRAAAAVAVVLGLLLVVGASARRPLNGGAAAPSLPTWPLLFVVGVGLVVSAALGIAVLGPIMRVRAGQSGRSALRAGPLTLSLSLLVPPPSSPSTRPREPTGERKAIGPPAPASHNKLAGKPGERGADHTTGVAALTAGVGAGVVGFAGLARRACAPPPRGRDSSRAATVAAGARDAAAAAAIPADPRAAVLAAYARMETALASVGLARRPSDAPREYLARLEAGLGGGRARRGAADRALRARPLQPAPGRRGPARGGHRRPGDAPRASSRRRRERGAHRRRRARRRRRRARAEPARCRRCAAPRPRRRPRSARAPATASTSTAWSAPRRATPATCTCACARSCARSRPTACAGAASSSTPSPRPRRSCSRPTPGSSCAPIARGPSDAFARGLAPARLDAVLDDLEALLR